MQNNHRATIIGGIIVLVIILALLFYANRVSGGPDKLDGFAQCLSQKGVTFYGAFWCPHCQNQKALFGNSKKFLPYIECSTPDGQNQTEICKEKGIKSYPTWVFKDMGSTTGEVPLAALSEKSGCPLPN